MVLYILVTLAFFFGAALVFGGYFGATKVPGLVLQRKLDQRLQEISSPLEDPVNPESSQGLVKTQAEGMLPAIDRMFGNTAKGSRISTWIEQSGVKTTVSTVLLMSLVGAGMLALLMNMLVGGGFAMFLGGALGFALPFMYLNFKRTRRMRKFEEEFPEALDLIARALKAGHAFVTGLKMVADEMEDRKSVV